jgi:CheY-like chemotaxis protein
MCHDPILYVDVDLISRLLNCAILRDCGYVVIEAQSLAEACRILQQRPKFAAVVTEVRLTGARDGFDLAHRARSVTPDVPVVYLSDTNLERCAREGVSGSCFVPRPFDAHQVAAALDAVTPLAPPRLDPAPRAT